MARRVPLELVALCLALLGPSASAADAERGATSSALVRYGFDDGELATGPDTFAVFERSNGAVDLSTAFKWSGYRSVEIRDAGGDGDFPELQGYFDLRRTGRLHAHFAILVSEPFESFNVALAGPRGFALEKDGIAFRLEGRGGLLHHWSDSMPKRLFALRPFVWYVVDVTYDIDAGRYDLAVHEEGARAAVVALTAQANAPNQSGSAVDKFSFIGDTGEDTSNVVYYVDDVILSVDTPTTQLPFVAPGRRKLFVDAWSERQRMARKKPGCLPAVEPSDLGFDSTAIARLEDEGALPVLVSLLDGSLAGPVVRTEALSSESRRLLDGAVLRRQGCAALGDGHADEALQRFDGAARLVPEAGLYELSAAVVLARLGRFDEADLRLAAIEPAFRNDPRYSLAGAMIGLVRDDLDEAEGWLRGSAEESSGAAPDRRLAEQYFFVLLWKGSFRKAERCAARMADLLTADDVARATWLERAGDAAFFERDAETALRWYTRSFEGGQRSSLLLTKLSDVYFLLGDVDRERELREEVYGRLAEAD